MSSACLTSLRHLAVCVAAFAALRAPAADPWAPNLTLAGTWHDNATNAIDEADQLDSLQLTADLLSWRDYELGRHDTLRLTAHLAGDGWPRYRRLLSGAAGGRAEWRHTLGTDPFAPTFSVEAAGDAFFAAERGRSGTTSALTAALRKRFNPHLRGAVLHEVGRHDARHAVYDRTSSETTLELGFDVSPASRLTLAARYRDGDVVSYATSPSAELASVTRVAESVNTFNRPHVASSFNARTWAARAAYLRAFDDASALVIAYEVRNTRAQPVRFTNQLLSVSIVHQF